MANTYKLITSTTLSSTTATVTFSAIPSTYTDLVISLSTRSDRTVWSPLMYMTINGNTSASYNYAAVGQANGSAFSSQVYGANNDAPSLNAGANATANAFGYTQYYIPSYNSSSNKVWWSLDAPGFNNATFYQFENSSSLWANTSAITSITFGMAGGFNFVANSSFYLYGILNS